MSISLHQALSDMPLVAILRGLAPDQAEAVGDILFEAGFRLLEVPLNSPDPFTSIQILADKLGEHALIGAGTVTTVQEVDQVVAAGGRLIISPHCDPEIIRKSKASGCISLPGIMTPSEAFSALRAGADGLKLFPCEIIGPNGFKAMKAILPKDVMTFPVGGINPEIIPKYWELGASGFGIGSALFKEGKPMAELKKDAENYVATIKGLTR